MRRIGSRRGSAMVESALVVLVFVIAIVELLDIGQVVFFYSMLTDRAQAGLRYALLNTSDPAVIANVVAYNNPSAPTGSGSGLFGLQTSMVTVNRYNTGTPSDRIEVAISNFPVAFYGPLLAATLPNRT